MIGVLVSGEGTNLQALLDAGLPVVAVASNRPARVRSTCGAPSMSYVLPRSKRPFCERRHIERTFDVSVGSRDHSSVSERRPCLT